MPYSDNDYIYIYCFQCFSRFLKEFSVPANSVGWQAVPAVYKNKNKSARGLARFKNRFRA